MDVKKKLFSAGAEMVGGVLIRGGVELGRSERGVFSLTDAGRAALNEVDTAPGVMEPPRRRRSARKTQKVDAPADPVSAETPEPDSGDEDDDVGALLGV